MKRIIQSNVIIAGVGGVGSYTAEALCRCGVGNITLIDCDIIELSNLNRQIHALHSTIGKKKVEAMRDRLEDINPNINCLALHCKIDSNFDFSRIAQNCHYMIDAVDDVKAKIRIIEFAKNHQIPVISSMGTGNRLNANFEITDIGKTKNCPLARKVRQNLRKIGIAEDIKVCFSFEPAYVKKSPPASISFVPATAGLCIANEVIRYLVEND